ncbi:TPA: hypothetical protein VB889_001936 [Streptococcus suis]|nr:hypothetical protein [Streptococcus suis]HEP1842455.1 hypothetical protein [Streptococcus suis]
MAVLKYSKVLLLVLLIATGLSCIGIYWLGKEQNRLLNEQWHALNIRIINDLGTKIDAIGGPQNPRIIGFFQRDDQTAISQRIGATLEKEEKTAKSDSLTQKEWIVLYPQTRNSPFENTAAYAVMKTYIRADWLQVTTSQEEELEVFYEKAHESLLTLEDLVQDKESFRAKLKTILVSAKNEAEIQVQKDILEMFESDDWSAIPFAYTEKSLILEKAVISISAFVDSLNPYYFSEQTLADLRLSEESRQALEDSVDKTIITYP